MKTQWQETLEERMKKEKKPLKVVVVNTEIHEAYPITAKVESTFHDIEKVLHKIRLDIMTNLHYGFKNPIQIYVTKDDGKDV